MIDFSIGLKKMATARGGWEWLVEVVLLRKYCTVNSSQQPGTVHEKPYMNTLSWLLLYTFALYMRYFDRYLLVLDRTGNGKLCYLVFITG
jgi:hypothetical protein